MFTHRNVYKFTWTSPDGKTHNQIKQNLIDKRRHSSVLDTRSFRKADRDPDHYLVVTKVRDRLAVSKRTMQLDMERFSHEKLNDVEGKAQFLFEIANRFAVLGSLDDDVNINRVRETIREHTEFQPKRV
jgi:hypothetical protein